MFAIFIKPCYNIRREKKGLFPAVAFTASLRAGLVIGVAAIIAAMVVSDAYILKIKVYGNGAYLAPEIRRIVLSEGGGEFKRFSKLNFSAATGKILSLPRVTFCNLERRGSVLAVDVRADSEEKEKISYCDLKSDCEGTVRRIVVICGTRRVSVGDKVREGDILISGEVELNDKTISVPPSGYCEIESSARVEYEAECESEENRQAAMSSALVDGVKILIRDCRTEKMDGKVVYTVDFTYLRTLSINLS